MSTVALCWDAYQTQLRYAKAAHEWGLDNSHWGTDAEKYRVSWELAKAEFLASLGL